MGFDLFSRITNKRKFGVVSEDAVMLTRRGEEAAQQEAHTGAKAMVLMTLDARKEITIKELAEETRLPIAKVKDIIADLMNRALVRKVGFES